MIDNSPAQPAPLQLRLDLGVRVEREVGGIEMGVLDNGISYLTQAGLGYPGPDCTSILCIREYRQGAFEKCLP